MGAAQRAPGGEAGAGGDGSPFFVSIVIVNYNGERYLPRLLDSLARQTCRAFETILVDNASTDGSAEWVAAHYPQVQLVRGEQNVGFAAGNNLGIRAARGSWIATLNTDTELAPDYLEQLAAGVTAAVDRSGAASRLGSCAPLMLEMDRREIVDAAGIEVDRFGFAWNRGAGRRASEFSVPGAVFGACAGAALYRRAMLDEIGRFDADYFAFYEDADLAWRAQQAGWSCLFVPGARVYHVHGASFGKMSTQKLFWLARNRWWTVLKNYPRPALAYYFPLIALADFAALLRSTLQSRSPEPLRGRVAAWRTRRAALAKREAFERARRAGSQGG